MPGLQAFLLKQLNDAPVERGIAKRHLTAFAEENSNGHTPDALARDAPVGARGDHICDALLAPGGIPLDAVFDFVEGALAKRRRRAVGILHRCVDGDEPLLRGAEDHRVVAAPAVGVAVVNVGPAEERAARGDQVDDRLIGLENSLAVVLREAIVQASVVIDVTGLVESIPRAGVKVVSAVGRGGVDGASSLVGRDVLGENAEDGAIQKRMLKRDPLHARAFEGRDGNGGFQIAGFANRGGERLGHDIDLTLLLERYVVEIRMKSDGE